MNRIETSRERTEGSSASEKALVYGFLLVVLVAGLLLAPSEPAHAATTFTVNSTGDENDLDFPSGTFDSSSDGECDVDSGTGNRCTLRAAIQEANVTNGRDLITFEIPEDPNDPADDVKTILVGGTPSPTSDRSLPEIKEAVTIDGYTQPGASPNTSTGLANGTNANLLIELNGALTGSSGSPGLRINASNVTVKGLVINRFVGGIFIFGGGSGNRIEGNFIGTDPSGGVQNPGGPVGNRGYGVNVFGAGANNTIGGTDADDGTVDGVVEARNLISGNSFRGLQIFGGDGGNRVQGNLIGTKANGTEALSNNREGVQIFSPNNTVGDSTGDDDAGANLIAFNGTDGVQVQGGLNSTFAVGNRILSNSIFSNGGQGIDLDGGSGFSNPDGDSVTANDSGDTDAGPNTLQNFPVLTSASRSRLDGSTTIEGTLDSTASTTFSVQFFSSPSADPSDHGEGNIYLGQTSDVTTDASGNASFYFTTQENVALGHFVTATATRLDTSTSPATPKDTSEFSEYEQVNVANDPPVNSVGGAQSIREDSALVFSQANSNRVSVSDPDAGTNPVKVTLSVTNGALTLGGIVRLTFTTGDGTSDADMTFTGTTTDINAALDGMRFDPAADYNGGATFTIATNDQGNTGGSGAKTDTDTVDITVSAVNDAPSFTKGPNQSVQDKTGAQSVASWATNISVGSPNEEAQSLEFIVTSDNDSLFTTTGRPAVSSNGTLTYTPAVNASGTANVDVVARDSGGTADGGDDTSDIQSFTITVNDATAPKVSGVMPGAGQTGVSRTPTITAIFSEKVKKDTLTSATFKLFKIEAGGNQTKVGGTTVSCDADQCQEAGLILSKPLAKKTRYKATVTTGVQDLAGNRLDQKPDVSLQSKSWTFTTGS